MKQLLLTIVCACMALAVIAGVPKPDAAHLRQALKKGSVTASTVVGENKDGQVSLQQFMRERNVSPGDNRLLNKAPRRLSPDELTGTRIATLEAQAFNLDENYNLLLNDTVYSIGWNAEISDDCTINGFFGSYSSASLPFYYDDEGSIFVNSYYTLREDTLKGEYGAWTGTQKYKTDTITSIVFFTVDAFFNGVYDDMQGTVYDDGTILFDAPCFVYTMEEYITYRKSVLNSQEHEYMRDTLCYASPVFSNIYLLNPNGIHEYDRQFQSSLIIDSIVNNTDGIDLHKIVNVVSIVNEEGLTFSDIIIVGGGNSTTLGLHPKPIDPRKPTRGSMASSDADSRDDDAEDNGDASGLQGITGFTLVNDIIDFAKLDVGSSGFGFDPLGLHPKPKDPRTPKQKDPINPIGGGIISSSNIVPTTINGTVMTPVYMFQLDDSTLCIYNMFGTGYTMNFLTMDLYGNMTIPGQVLCYDENTDEDYFICSAQGDSLVLGCTGTATPDTIAWGTTMPCSVANMYLYAFSNNKLYFTNGEQFNLPLLLGDVNRDRQVTVNDVTTLINHLLTGDFNDSATFLFNAADVNRNGVVSVTDLTALINILLTRE